MGVKKKPKDLPSLSAFVEGVAKMLRTATKSTPLTKRKISKTHSPLSSSNKIGQIAKLLRSQTKRNDR